MEKCILCEIVNGRLPSKKIYEDKDILAVLDINGANVGHTFVIPKSHFTIMEQVPDDIIGKSFSIANKVSKTMFDTLNIQGTNLFVSNGVSAGQQVAHFLINVIPRKENDGINLQWTPKKLTEEEMSTMELQLKDAQSQQSDIPQPDKKIKKAQVVPEQNIIRGSNNFLRQIRRIP